MFKRVPVFWRPLGAPVPPERVTEMHNSILAKAGTLVIGKKSHICVMKSCSLWNSSAQEVAKIQAAVDSNVQPL